jgi:hypothetical protein
MLLFLILPSLVWAQKQERQMGDTTFFKTLIPETKQESAQKCKHDCQHELCLQKRICGWRIYTIKVQK